MTDNFHFYKEIIYQTLPRTNYIWTPAVPGAKQNVVLAREPGGDTYAFKFTDQNYAIRNASIAQALRDAGIPVPNIIAMQFDNQWFEIYPAINGQTLYECVGDGISHTELVGIYTQLLKIFEKMSQIDSDAVNFGTLRHAHQIAYRDTKKTNNVFFGRLVSGAVQLMNIGPRNNTGLYHHGMTPKNIIISNRGEIAGILDIDEAGICNRNYALGVMLAKAKLIGMDTKSLCDEYERTTGQHINRLHLSAVIAVQNFGRNILYRTKTK
ncbi:MAG: phosphotransferase [Muribaculaceae bacterium]|nr:phosphotransferase [Muribaculaceae bacterium]